MTRPAVTVVVTSYNYGQYVAVALESVRAQTMSNFECIVVDDGSTDNSISVIESFLRDPRFRIVRQKNQGVSQARNVALEAACAPFVAFLDADDVWRPEKLERQLARFHTDPALGVVFSRRTIIDAQGNPLPCTDEPAPEGKVVEQLFRQNFVCFSSAMVRTEAALRVGGIDQRLRLAVDYDFWLKIARHYPFGMIDEPLVSYRIGHGNLSRRQRERYYVALYVMNRFEHQIDRAATLSRSAARIAEAETYTNLGTLTRGYSRWSAIHWLVRALRISPTLRSAWRGLAAAILPAFARRLIRALRHKSGDWEKSCYTAHNQPEAVL